MHLSSPFHSDQVPGEPYLIHLLQKSVIFSVGNKTIRKGRLLLFKKYHYYIQMALLSEKGQRENCEFPIPFKIENYPDEGLLYFDYRLKSLDTDFIPKIPERISSVYFNKILEIQIANIYT